MTFQIQMKHDRRTMELLSHMQYDLFCRRNRVVRMMISTAVMVLGVINYSAWWGILLIAYGCYLMTSIYSSANRTAHKLAQQIEASGLGYPHSEYGFDEEALHILSLPSREEVNEPLPYSKVLRLGEDAQYYYIFRDEYGGYMISKVGLGDRLTQFRDFIEKKTGMAFINPRSPMLRLLAQLRRRENEPYHL